MACHYDCFFINGVWVKPHSDDVISLENPATGEVFAHVPDGTPEDVANAIEAGGCHEFCVLRDNSRPRRALPTRQHAKQDPTQTYS